MKKEKDVKKIKQFWAVFSSILVSLILFNFVTIDYSLSNLNAYVDTLKAVEYDNQYVPVKDASLGYYTIDADRDIKIVQITDFHIGGGRYTVENDKKAIYEVSQMITNEKPDLVILTGDMIFACPGPVFNGGGTFNNLRAHKVLARVFEKLGVYYTVTFGNHDTEAFDYSDRKTVGDFYSSEDLPHCIFESNFCEVGGDYNRLSVSNQCIVVRSADKQTIKKAIFVIDSNDYTSDSIMASINWDYDSIHDNQVQWVKTVINNLSAIKGSTVKSLFFFHIPISEYEMAYRDLATNNFVDTPDTLWVSGFWDESVNDGIGGRIWYGSCGNQDIAIADHDTLFEVASTELGSMEACFCGHDHVNTSVVKYKGVILSYGNSIDNIAYSDINSYGIQRGCTVITIANDGTFSQVHKNAYLDYPNISTDMFVEVNLTNYIYDNAKVKGE